MLLSPINFVRNVQIGDNPENLDLIKEVIIALEKEDKVTTFRSLSTDSESIFFEDSLGLTFRPVLPSGYQSLLSMIGVPSRLAMSTSSHIEIPLVNGMIRELYQRNMGSSRVKIRLISQRIRAVLSNSYKAIDDIDVMNILDSAQFLSQIRLITFNCDNAESETRIITREQNSGEFNGYTVTMYLYILNNEIGEASLRCGIGINITSEIQGFRSFNLLRDQRSLGRIIHRGDTLNKLERQLTTTFGRATSIWELLRNGLTRISTFNTIEIISLEEKIINSLKSMPEFNVWKESYDKMREAAVINNMFDLLYLMTSIPYRNENFNNVVEEILYGRLF